jgi:hypothetical protein
MWDIILNTNTYLLGFGLLTVILLFPYICVAFLEWIANHKLELDKNGKRKNCLKNNIIEYVDSVLTRAKEMMDDDMVSMFDRWRWR